jgi:hypothetical protein
MPSPTLCTTLKDTTFADGPAEGTTPRVARQISASKADHGAVLVHRIPPNKPTLFIAEDKPPTWRHHER